MASTLHLKGLEQIFKQNLDVENDTIKAVFMQTGYTPNASTHSYYSDVSASIASGATPFTLTSGLVSINDGSLRIQIDFDDISLSTQTFSSNKFLIYKDTGSAATSPVIATIDIVEGTISPVGGPVTVTINSSGVFGISST